MKKYIVFMYAEVTAENKTEAARKAGDFLWDVDNEADHSDVKEGTVSVTNANKFEDVD